MLLLNLSRASFWLAAVAAAWSLAAPGGHETALTAAAGVFALAALALWRSALVANAREDDRDPAPVAPVLDRTSLIEAAQAVVRITHDKPAFEDALRRVGEVLKTELGARSVRLLEVGDAADDGVAIAERPAQARGARLPTRRLALGQAAPATRGGEPGDRVLAEAIASGEPRFVMPDTVALPVGCEGRVVALLELSGIGMTIEPGALGGLLDVARLSLAPLARPFGAADAVPSGPPSGVPPLAPAEPGVAPSLGPISVRQTGPRVVGLGSVHVLVVEDNVTQTETTARLLRRLGCRVTPASGMLAGLQALCETQFDLVLMDTAMPGVGAQDALAWLRGQPQGAFRFVSTSDTPVVAMIAQGLPPDLGRFRELGFDDCLFKPLRQEALSAMLNRHLRARSPSADGGGSGAPGPVRALDAASLDRLRELDPSGQNHLVERVLKAFQTSAARLLPQLETAHAANDTAAIRLVAHTLKSSSASIGALALSQQCALLETSIRNEQFDELDRGVAAMTDALQAALRSIQQVLDETP